MWIARWKGVGVEGIGNDDLRGGRRRYYGYRIHSIWHSVLIWCACLRSVLFIRECHQTEAYCITVKARGRHTVDIMQGVMWQGKWNDDEKDWYPNTTKRKNHSKYSDTCDQSLHATKILNGIKQFFWVAWRRGSNFTSTWNHSVNHKPAQVWGTMQPESSAILKSFAAYQHHSRSALSQCSCR